MSMRAYAVDEFGAPGSIHQLPIPEPGPGEILVTVHAAGVNVMDPLYVVGALRDYMEHRFPLVPGIDFAGVVERVGPDVDGFGAGDEVYGANRLPASRLPELTALIDGGQLRVPPIAAFPLDATGEALKAMSAGHVRGKLVITVR